MEVLTPTVLAGGGGGGGISAPGGSDTQIQFNDSGSLGGDVDLTWNKTTNVMTVAGDVNLSDGGSFTTTLQTITPTANRTVSIPDATGTLALVAGSSGQLLWNNAGANAGASTLTYDGSILTTSGRFINSYNSGSLAPAKTFTGTWATGAGTTNTKPHVLIETTGATSNNWSNSGTGLGVNAASGFSGNLLDLQVNGATKFYVHSNSSVQGIGFGSVNANNTPTNGFVLNTGLGLIGNNSSAVSSGAISVLIRRSLGALINDAEALCFGNTSTLAVGTRLFQDAAGILAQRNGTDAQTFRVYNTYTSSTNYELGKLEWSGNVFRIGTEKGSGGGTARALELQTDGTTRWTISASSGSLQGGANAAIYVENGGVGRINYSSISFPTVDGNITLNNWNANGFNRLQFGGTTSSFPALKRNSAVLETKLADDSAYAQHAASVFQAATAHTVATLPATPVVGMIARVTDATAPAVGSTVAGSGAAAALVWYNGTNWTVIGV